MNNQTAAVRVVDEQGGGVVSSQVVDDASMWTQECEVVLEPCDVTGAPVGRMVAVPGPSEKVCCDI